MIKTVGLTGMNAAGKGEAAAILADLGYHVHSLSDIVREEAAAAGLELTRENMIRTGNRLREQGGAGVLAERILPRLEFHSAVDSIRNPAEINVLRGLEHFILLGITADPKLRFERMVERGRFGDSETYEDFLAKEALENTDSPTGQQLKHCMDMADTIIENNGTIESLQQQIRAACQIA